jgi:hypothetical protein
MLAWFNYVRPGTFSKYILGYKNLYKISTRPWGKLLTLKLCITKL